MPVEFLAQPVDQRAVQRADQAKVQWKAHNYNHLHEAPTVFHAVCLVLAVAGQGHGWAAEVAWGYVALRVVHSLVQATVNLSRCGFSCSCFPACA